MDIDRLLKIAEELDSFVLDTIEMVPCMKYDSACMCKHILNGDGLAPNGRRLLEVLIEATNPIANDYGERVAGALYEPQKALKEVATYRRILGKDKPVKNKKKADSYFKKPKLMRGFRSR